MSHFSNQFNRFRETFTRFQAIELRESIGVIESFVKIIVLNRS